MPLAKFQRWRIYESIEPFGERRADMQAGMVCAAIYNQHRTKDSDRFWTYLDFIPQWDPKPEVRQSPEEQLNMFLAIQTQQNAIVAAREGR